MTITEMIKPGLAVCMKNWLSIARHILIVQNANSEGIILYKETIETSPPCVCRNVNIKTNKQGLINNLKHSLFSSLHSITK